MSKHYELICEKGRQKYVSPHFLAVASIAEEWQLDQAIGKALERYRGKNDDYLDKVEWRTYAYRVKSKRNPHRLYHGGWVYIWVKDLRLANLLRGLPAEQNNLKIKLNDANNMACSSDGSTPMRLSGSDSENNIRCMQIKVVDLELSSHQFKIRRSHNHIKNTPHVVAEGAWVNLPRQKYSNEITTTINLDLNQYMVEDIYYGILSIFENYKLNGNKIFLGYEWTNTSMTLSIKFSDPIMALFAMQCDKYLWFDEYWLEEPILMVFNYISN